MKFFKKLSIWSLVIMVVFLNAVAFAAENPAKDKDKKHIENRLKNKDYVIEKIMSKNEEEKIIELELKGNVKITDKCKIYQVIDGKKSTATIEDIMVGAENIIVLFNKSGAVDEIIIDGRIPIKNMRVGIMDENFSSIDHGQIEIQSESGLKIIDKIANETIKIAGNEVVSLYEKDGKIIVNQGDEELYTTENRLYVFSARDESLLKILTLERGGWSKFTPEYRGFFEITLSPEMGKLRLINEVQLEEYLYQVVPSEMPASFGLGAMKAQAVAARTYALSDYYKSRYAMDGFHVDDSVMSQVYNNSPENEIATQAVNETKGMVMLFNGDPVDARYHSTSSGFGIAKHEVWEEMDTKEFPGIPVPYLTAVSYTYDPQDNSKMLDLIDSEDEEAYREFFTNLSYTGYGSHSSFWRWKVELTKEELENTINKNIGLRQEAEPEFILTQDISGEFVMKEIPEEGIGTLKNIYIRKRGSGGNAMEMIIEGSTGTYKVLKELNIRFVIRPRSVDTGGDDVILYTAPGGSENYTGSRKNFSIMPSASFVMDIVRNGEEIEKITFYGGGFGHGVGMSQYGAADLGEKGWDYDKILKTYYPGITITDVYSEEYIPKKPNKNK